MRSIPRGRGARAWRLLTTHAVNDTTDARRIVQLVASLDHEQLFRTTKTKGFDIESLRSQEQPLEKLVAATIVAAVTVMQLVRDERDGRCAAR